MVDVAVNEEEKIEYLIDTYVDPHAGTEKQLYQLIQTICKYNYLPHLTLLRPSEYIEEHGFPCDVSVLGIYRLFKLSSIRKIISYGRKIRKEGCRLVHIYFNDTSIITPIILKLCGLKVIISRRDMGYWYNRINLRILRINAYFVDAVVTNCLAVKTITHQKEHIPLSRIHVIFNGFQAKENAGSISVPEQILQLKGGMKIIGIVANIRPIKRIDDLLKAFAMVREKLTEVALVIVGAGDISQLSQLAKELGIEDVVIFAGKQEDTEAYIRHFDVGVLCSESEGLSNAIIEYMYYGIPVVCTRTGGNVELIEDGVNGYLFEIGDIDSLAGELLSLLQNKELADQFRRKSAQHIREVCSMNSMTEGHIKLYKNLVDVLWMSFF